MTMIEMGKQYRTRVGYDVRIYAIDAGGALSVHGAIKGSTKWFTAEWTAEGHAPNREDEKHDLIEQKPKITRTYWLVHFGRPTISTQRTGSVLASYEDAKSYAADRSEYGDIAITGPHTIEFEEGEGIS